MAGSHLMLCGAQVDDADAYARYRAGMRPILARYGGGFVHDFLVARVLESTATHPINRVFMIRFPDRAVAAAFFADADYLAVRRALFEPSVSALTVLAEYDLA